MFQTKASYMYSSSSSTGYELALSARLAPLKCYSRELRREGRARHPYLGKALGSFACAKERAKHTGPPF